ncbi:MAG TPA: prepilin-type N-terminal cleavage/methylation domain-containing protein [Thermoleophilia bacterium]
MDALQETREEILSGECRASERSRRGFTLIELLVVIIVAILALIAIPTFLGQRQKAQDAAAKSLIRTAATAIEPDVCRRG